MYECRDEAESGAEARTEHLFGDGMSLILR
jgi:hypothetical protein